MTRPSRINWVLGLAALAALGLSPLIGAVDVPFSTFLHPFDDTPEASVLWQIRIPRVLLSFLAGAALSLSGMSFQAMFRNPLATPFTLGIASGASLGAALGVRLGVFRTALGGGAVSICAFLGALTATAAVYGLTRLKKGFSTATMLLAGVAISFFFSSLILFVQFTSNLYDSFRILRWLMGGLQTVDYGDVRLLTVVVLVGSGVILFLRHELNLMTTGEDIATSRGVNVNRLKIVLFLTISLVVGAVVAVCGPIGFVGLMCPHTCRLMVGSNHRYLSLASFLFGGMFLTVCDTFARTVVAPIELPVGVVTAFLGGPFFLWLLLRGSSEKGIV
ncbi:iron ABC transporter permease [Candidatus Sumerlaeota bacterium]|nr:iron ABC transporter permease [Candidatus Sumerlaeota bacterium]